MPDEFKRYYYWETVPGQDTRCLGNLTGYPTLDECVQDMAPNIERNRKAGYPCWVAGSSLVAMFVGDEEQAAGPVSYDRADGSAFTITKPPRKG